MNISEMLRLAFSVVADWRVIVTAVLTVFIISLANYVIRYKKRPLSLKKRKALLKAQAEAATAAAKTEKKEEGQGEADGASGDHGKKSSASSSASGAKKK